MTNLRSLSDLFKAAMKLAAAAIISALILLVNPHTAFAQQWTTTGNDISNANSGNVGVGTSTPIYKFDVLSTTNILGRFSSTAAANNQLLINAPSGFNSNLTLQHAGLSKWYLGNRAANDSFSLINAGGSVEVFSILQNGSVGIGTITPSAALQINSITPGLAAVKVKGAPSQTANLLEFRSSDDTLRSYVNSSGALFFNPAMDQVASAITIAPNFNGAYYAGAEHNAFTINGANMANYGLYTNPTVRMFLIKDVNGYNAFEVNKIGMATLRGDMSNRSWVTNIHVDSGNAYYAGNADGLLINGTGLANHGLYSGGTVRMLRVVGTGEALAVTRDNRTGFGTLTPAARVEIMGSGSTSATMGLSVKNSGGGSLFHVRDDGNVGVGVASPAYKLDVAGQVRSSSGGFVFPDGTVQTTAATGGGTASQWSNGTNSINYNAGNVGIGTGDPAEKLEVAGSVYISGTNYLRFPHAYGDANDGKIGNSMFGSGLNLVGINNDNTFRKIQLWGQITQNQNDGTNSWAGTNYFSGNVGIGNNSPSTKLQVAGGTRIDGTNGRVYLGTGAVAGARGLEFIEENATTFSIRHHNPNVAWQNIVINPYAGKVGIGTLTPTETLEVGGNIKASGTIFAKYQDLAEWVPSSEQLASGTVVVLDTTKSNQVVSSSTGYDTRVAGVISAQPGITLGESGEGKVLVATTGRVRVKVDASRGAIQIGDLLVTSDVPGVAMKSEAVSLGGVQIHRPGTIIGKALEPLAKGSGEILVLLSLQ